MTLTEAIEYGTPSVDLVSDAEWCEFALETMKRYKELISDDNKDTDNKDTFKIGDRVELKTLGGWYNCGIIIDIDEDRPDGYSYLIEVDELGYTSPGVYIPFPYHVRTSSNYLIKVESEE